MNVERVSNSVVRRRFVVSGKWEGRIMSKWQTENDNEYLNTGRGEHRAETKVEEGRIVSANRGGRGRQRKGRGVSPSGRLGGGFGCDADGGCQQLCAIEKITSRLGSEGSSLEHGFKAAERC